MTMVGMNLEEVRRTAAGLGRQAEALKASQQRIDRLLGKLDWQGGDAHDFSSDWRSRQRSVMDQAVQYLRDSAKTLSQQAGEQKTTSSSGGGIGGITLEVPSGPVYGIPKSPIPAFGFVDGFADWTRDRMGDAADWGHDRIDEAADWSHDRIVDVGNGINWAGQRVQEGAQWTGDRVVDGAAWLGGVLSQEASVAAVGLQRQGEAALGFGMHTISEIAQGRLPQTSEIGAYLALAGGLSVGTTANVLTGTDQKIFAQGKPVVGDPHVVARPPINGLADLVGGMPDTYNSDGVRVTAQHNPGEPTRYIVEGPGTQAPMFGDGGWNGNPNARDWPANLWAVSTGDSAYGEGVKQAIAAAIAKDQAAYGDSGGRPEIVLSGHSQAGIVMANLTSDSDFTSKYDIRGVVTAGSPVECAEIPDNIKVLSIQHGAPEVTSTIAATATAAVIPPLVPVVQAGVFLTSGDIVPATDDGGRTILGTYENHPNITRVVTAAPGQDPLTNHAQDNYASDTLDRPDVHRYEDENGLADFYGGSSTTYDIPVGVTFG
jgi:hypothetical protein